MNGRNILFVLTHKKLLVLNTNKQTNTQILLIINLFHFFPHSFNLLHFTTLVESTYYIFPLFQPFAFFHSFKKLHSPLFQSITFFYSFTYYIFPLFQSITFPHSFNLLPFPTLSTYYIFHSFNLLYFPTLSTYYISHSF